MINTAIPSRPPDMAITMHLCRGNFRSSWIAQGGYEPVAELLFNQIGVDGYFMEFDTERAGGFEPLRFVPKARTWCSGLVTSKAGALEAVDDLGRRIADGGEVCSAGSTLSEPAVRLRQHRGREQSLRRKSNGRSWRASLRSREKCGASERRCRCRRAARPRPMDCAAKALDYSCGAGHHLRRFRYSDFGLRDSVADSRVACGARGFRSGTRARSGRDGGGESARRIYWRPLRPPHRASSAA